MIGRKFTKKWKEKIGKSNSIALKGKHPNDETRKKLSLSIKKSWQSRSRIVSKSTRDKISKAARNISNETRLKMSRSQKERFSREKMGGAVTELGGSTDDAKTATDTKSIDTLKDL